MTEIILSLAQLRGMIGLRLIFRDNVFTVIEVLEDIPAIVMQGDNPGITIQADAHGYAHKQVKEIITLHVLSADKTQLHPDFLEIDLL